MRYIIVGMVAIAAGFAGLGLQDLVASTPVRLHEGEIAEISFNCCWQDLESYGTSCIEELDGEACGGSGVTKGECEEKTISCNEVVDHHSWTAVKENQGDTTWWGIDGGGVCTYKPGGACEWRTEPQDQCVCASENAKEELPYANYYSGCTPSQGG